MSSSKSGPPRNISLRSTLAEMGLLAVVGLGGGGSGNLLVIVGGGGSDNLLVIVDEEGGGLDTILARWDSAFVRKLSTASIADDVTVLSTDVKLKLLRALVSLIISSIVDNDTLGITGSRAGVARLTHITRGQFAARVLKI